MARMTLNPSKEFEKKLNLLSEFLNLKDTYGEIPKTLDFSLTFSIEMLAFYDKVIPLSFASKVNSYLSSVETLKYSKNFEENLKEIAKHAQK